MTPGAIHTVARGEASRVTRPRLVLVRDLEHWQRLWAEHAGETLATPEIDFETRMAAAVFAGERPTPGHQVIIAGTRREGSALVLDVEEHRPASGMLIAQILTSPFHIVTLPRYDGDVRFAGPGIAPGTAAIPEPAPPWRRHDPAPSSTGLSPRAAASLAYLAGPFSGALMLATEQTSRFVRFHAWQALVALGIIGVAAVLFLALAFGFLIASPTAFWVMLWLAAATAMSWLAVWAACLFHAYRGHLWKLPLAGAFAERRTFG